MKGIKHLSKGQILAAQAATLSNRAAARYLGCSYQHYRKYATAYGLLESHKNQSGKGIPKFLSDKKDGFKMEQIMNGTIDASHFDPDKLKYRMIEAGLMKDECYQCGFNEKRVLDGKLPLLLNFKDGNPRYWNNGNAEFLCYNCYFLIAGNVFTQKDLILMESTLTPETTSERAKLEVDDYTKKRLIELGLMSDAKPGEEYLVK